MCYTFPWPKLDCKLLAFVYTVEMSVASVRAGEAAIGERDSSSTHRVRPARRRQRRLRHGEWGAQRLPQLLHDARDAQRRQKPRQKVRDSAIRVNAKSSILIIATNYTGILQCSSNNDQIKYQFNACDYLSNRPDDKGMMKPEVETRALASHVSANTGLVMDADENADWSVVVLFT